MAIDAARRVRFRKRKTDAEIMRDAEKSRRARQRLDLAQQNIRIGDALIGREASRRGK
jgi:hypothetical protein